MDLIVKIRFRRSVGKHCRTQTEPIYRRAQQPTPRLRAFQERLENWLQTERLLPKAQRRTARRLFDEPGRERLGQFRDGELFLVIEDRTYSPQSLPRPRRSPS